jgi:hypothetical protein
MEKHFSDECCQLVTMSDFYGGFMVFKFCMVMGVPAGQDASVTQLARSVLRHLSTDSQATMHVLLLILDDLFASGSCMRRIHSGIFVVDGRTGVLLLSVQGHRDIIPMSGSVQVDRNVRELAKLVRNLVWRTGSVRIAVQQVEDGLLLLMETQGATTWPNGPTTSSVPTTVNSCLSRGTTTSKTESALAVG